jgi:hypothetical protein
VTWEVFIVLVLAIVRLHRLIAYDEITKPLRDSWISTHERVQYWVECPWCLGFWLTLAVLSGWSWRGHWLLVFSIPLAVSELVGIIASKIDT